MLMTRETDYALRILRALGDGRQKSIDEIGRLEATPRQFAYKIIKKLEKAGWITIARGAEGGCRLAVDLRVLDLYQLTCATGKRGCVSPCLEPGYVCTREAVCTDVCRAQGGLARVQRAIDEELKRHSLYELIFGEEAQ